MRALGPEPSASANSATWTWAPSTPLQPDFHRKPSPTPPVTGPQTLLLEGATRKTEVLIPKPLGSIRLATGAPHSRRSSSKMLRRKRDSNPRNREAHRLSKTARSSTLPFLQCARWESNPHAFRHQGLKLARLPSSATRARAPGGNRTHTERGLSSPPLPLGYLRLLHQFHAVIRVIDNCSAIARYDKPSRRNSLAALTCDSTYGVFSPLCHVFTR